jgi:hypothetical protein
MSDAGDHREGRGDAGRGAGERLSRPEEIGLVVADLPERSRAALIPVGDRRRCLRRLRDSLGLRVPAQRGYPPGDDAGAGKRQKGLHVATDHDGIGDGVRLDDRVSLVDTKNLDRTKVQVRLRVVDG